MCVHMRPFLLLPLLLVCLSQAGSLRADTDSAKWAFEPLNPVAKPSANGGFEYQVQIDGQAVTVPEADLAKRLAKGAKPLPHLEVGSGPRDFDQIMVLVLKRHLPKLLGPVGLLIGTRSSSRLWPLR